MIRYIYIARIMKRYMDANKSAVDTVSIYRMNERIRSWTFLTQRLRLVT